MKVGDLVTLSSYGQRRKFNRDCLSGYGIVCDIATNTKDRYPVTVHWFEGEKQTTYYFSRRELKHYKPDKK